MPLARVRFELLGGDSKRQSVDVYVESLSTEKFWITEGAEGGPSELDLPEGEYLAAARDSSTTERGAAVEFTVDEPLEVVELPAPLAFDLVYLLLDNDTEAAVAGARVELAPVRAILGEEPREAVSDEDGRVRFSSVAPGEYRLFEGADGFVGEAGFIELPGKYRPWLVNGTLDLRYRYLLPRLDAEFLIRGTDEWGGAQGFRIAHVGDSAMAPVPFGSDGTARVSVGEYRIPIEFAVDYPGGDRAIFYFGPEFRWQGAPNIVDVSGHAVVDIDVRVSSALEEILFSEPCVVQVTFRRSDGSSMQINRVMDDERVIRLRAPFAGHVMASLMRVEGGSQVTWAAREARVEEGGQPVSILISVDAEPVRLQVTGGEGPVEAGASVVAYTLPDRTAWAAAWVTDHEGIVRLPRVAGGELALSCYLDGELRAIDHLVDLPAPGEVATLRLAPGVRSRFRVTRDGRPVQDAWVLIQGAESRGLESAAVPSAADGLTTEIQLSLESRAIATVDLGGDVWPLRPELVVQPGVNDVRVFSVGELRAASRGELLGAHWEWNGEGLEEWTVTRDLVVSREGGMFAARVPVGEYRVELDSGASKTATVTAGEFAVLRGE